MYLIGAALLFGGLAAGQVMDCNSVGLEDGDQGVKQWRATTKDCAEATNKLEDHLEYVASLRSPGCIGIVSSGDCEISMCDPSALTGSTPVYWTELWAATRALHARHKHDGKVAAYVGLYDDQNSKYKVYVKLAKKGTPDPVTNKRRGLFGRRSSLDEELERQETINATAMLERRTDTGDNMYNLDREDIPNANGVYVNVRVGYRDREFVATDQVQNAQENLLQAWRDAGDQDGDVAGRTYAAPGNMRVRFEYAAHNNHNIRNINEQDLNEAARFVITERERGGNHGTFMMQIRRGVESIGHLAIYIWNPQLEFFGCG